eukprot:scaffold48410_cov42-Prasinocladus_malaysianus.AAC.1
MTESGAASGEAAEGLQRICSAADAADVDQLNLLLSTLQSDAARWKLSSCEDFCGTAKSIAALHALKNDVKKAVKSRNSSILQYCVDTVTSLKVAGQKEDALHKKA